MTNNNKTVMLSTIDNPFNYFTDFDNWQQFDLEKGYHTLELLARFLKTSDECSEAEQNEDIEDAINRIMNVDVLGIYCKVYDNT